jgi:uncharacterized protein YkwD
MSSAAHVRRCFRALAAIVAATIVGLVAAPSNTSAAPAAVPPVVSVLAPRPTYYATDVQYLVNAYRRRAGVPAVSLSWQLNSAAVAHAKDMASRRFMSHTGSDGSNAGTRISRTGYRWWIWGENVAAGQVTSSQVVWAWLNSPSHKAIMLDRRYRHMGLGRAVASDGTPYWCLVFASLM